MKLCPLFLILFISLPHEIVTSFSAVNESVSKIKSLNQDVDPKALYQKAHDSFNNGEYEKSIEMCKSIIKFYHDNRITDLSADSPYELSFFLIADCQVRLGKPEAAQAAIAEFVSMAEKGSVPRAALPKAELKSANIHLQFHNYDKALFQFEKVIRDFPDSAFSKYVEEKINEISASKTGEIKGLAKIRGAVNSEGISLTTFNGFGTTQATSGADGSYTLPVFKSTRSTYLVLIAEKVGYLPEVISIAMTEDGEVRAKEIEIAPLEDENCGILVGICYKTIQGGKLRPAFGINSFVPGVEIVLSGGEKRFNVKSDKRGIYRIILSPGIYKLLLPPEWEDRKIEIKPGRTSVFNLGFPGIRID